MHWNSILVSASRKLSLQQSLFFMVIQVTILKVIAGISFVICNFSDSLTKVHLGNDTKVENHNLVFRNYVQETVPR